MKRIFALIISLIISGNALAQTSDEEQIKKVIMDSYINGIHNRTMVEEISKGFHPCFVLLGIGNDKSTVTLLPIYNWLETVKARKEKDGPAANKVECDFKSIDITGTAAVAKIVLSVQGKNIFTDYLGLYKFKEGWRIVNKIYQAMSDGK